VNLYTVFAALCVVLAISGFWENVKTVLREDLPLEPAARRGFLTGMFGVSAMLVVAAAVLVFQAIRKSRSTGAEMASFAHAPTKGSDLRVTPAADGQDVATDDGQAMNGQKA
jgi:hypothetical protein